MAFGEVAELAVLLKLRDELSGPLHHIDQQLAGLNNRTASVHGGIGKIGQGFGQMATAAVAAGAVAGVAVAGVGIAAVKSAADFQASMTLIQTQAGGTAQEVQSMTKGILDLSTQVGTSANDLAAGLYHIESAGLRGAQALDILRVAAEGARVGNADLESVTNALIASVNSGVKGTTDMAGAMGTLNAIVGSGNMRMQDLTDAFSTGILSTAKTFGISIQSVGAAIADMTNQGVPAIDAATRLRMSISLLGAPTSQAAKEFKSIGIAQLDLANAMRGPGGIAAAVQMLSDHMQKAGLIDKSGNVTSPGADLLSKAFGGGRSSSAIMTLVGSIAKLNAIQDQVNKGAGGFGDAWAKTQEDVTFRAAKLGVTLDTLKLRLGEALLPAAGNILDALATELAKPEVTQGVTAFGNAIAAAFSPENIHAAFDFAGTILPEIAAGAQMVLGIAKQGFDIFNALPGPLKTVAIAALIGTRLPGAGLVMSGVTDIARSLLGRVGGALPGPLGAVAGAVGGYGTPVIVTNWPAGFGMGGPGGLPVNPAVAAGASGLLAPGAVTAAVTAAAPFLMFYGLPALWNLIHPTTPEAGAGVGGRAALVSSNPNAPVPVLSSQQRAMLLGLMPSADTFLAQNGYYNPAEQTAAAAKRAADTATLDRIAAAKGDMTPSAALTTKLSGYLQHLLNVSGSDRSLVTANASQAVTWVGQIADRFSASTSPSLRSMVRNQDTANRLLATLKKAGDKADANAMIPYLAAINASILRINPSLGLTPSGAPGYETHAGRDDTKYKPVTVKGSPNPSPIVGFNLNVKTSIDARQNDRGTSVQRRYGPTPATSGAQ